MNYTGIASEEKVDKSAYFPIGKAIDNVDTLNKKLKRRSSYYYNPTVDAVLIQSESFFILQGMKPDVYFSTFDFRRFEVLFADLANTLTVLGKETESKLDTRPAEIASYINNCYSSYKKANAKRLKEATGYDKKPVKIVCEKAQEM